MATHGFTARKSLAAFADDGDRHRLGRTLGPWSITAMGIGAVIGAGIFVLTGTAAARYAGPAITLSFVLGGVACAFVGLCYAELAAMLPVSGSSYSYTYATLGEVFAWIVGWDLVLEYAAGAAAVAVGWSKYATSLLGEAGLTIPPRLAAGPGAEVTLPDGSRVAGLLNLPAAAVVIAITGLLVVGTAESSRLNNVMVAVKVAVVALFVGFGAFALDPAHWRPFLPPNAGGFGHFGWSGVLRGASVVFFAFIGFDAVSTAAQEAKRPQRDMPIGILASLTLCTLLYVAVAAVLTGLVPYGELDVADPIAKGVDAIGHAWLSLPVKLGAVAGLTTVMLVLLYGQGRIFFTMARDGLLPPLFGRVHPRFGTPVASQLTVGAAVAVAAALTPIDVLGEMVSIGTLLAFALVCFAVIRLRRTDPGVERPFRCPAVPLVPGLGILFCAALMTGLPPFTWARLVIWLAVGLSIYAFYGRHHSTLGRSDRPV